MLQTEKEYLKTTEEAHELVRHAVGGYHPWAPCPWSSLFRVFSKEGSYLMHLCRLHN